MDEEKKKEYQRKYMADRRARQRERGGIEGVMRAKDVEHSAPHLKAIKGDIPAFQECDIESGAIDSMVKPILPVPVLAEPNRNIEGNSSSCGPLNPNRTGEARESTNVKPAALSEQDSCGGQSQSMNQIPPPIEAQHTKTDQLFENKKPGYYIFEKEVIEKKCWYCGEGFETRLRLNRFCSPDHKERWLTMSFRMGKE